MIARIKGRVCDILENAVVVDVSGVGYEVNITMFDSAKLQSGDEVVFFTHHHIREQDQALFGFLTAEVKLLFRLLITVQGVGPRAAMAILGLGEFEDIRNAIACSDSKFVQKAVGVGKKTAERVVLDLNDKVGVATKYSNTDVVSTASLTSDDAVDALVSLGYTQSDAQKSLEGVDRDLPLDKRITAALKNKT